MSIRKFINESKEKKISAMSEEEIKKALRTEKLDEYTVNAMAKRLGVDLTAIPDNIECHPKILEGTTPKQNLLRMLSGDFVEGDTIKDKNNHTSHTYCEQTSMKLYFCRDLEPKGFETSIDFDTMDKDKQYKINIPQKIFGLPIIAVSTSNNEDRNTEKKFELDVKAEKIDARLLLIDSGITNIPDFNSLQLKNHSHPVDIVPADADYIYSLMKNCRNIEIQTVIDYVTKASKQNGNMNQDLATQYLNKYFGINKFAKDLTSDDIGKMNNIMQTINQQPKEEKVMDAIKYMCHISTKKHPDIYQSEVIRTIDKLGIHNAKDAIALYLSSISQDQAQVFSTTIHGQGITQSPAYVISGNDGFAVIYNERTQELSIAGKEKDGSIILNEEYSECELTQISNEQKLELFTKLQCQFNSIANDIFEKDATEVPITSADEKYMEK